LDAARTQVKQETQFQKEDAMKVDLCPVAEIPAEGTKEVDFFDRKVHVVMGEGSVPAAFMDVCMHLGGPLACRDGRFACEWHRATFDKNTGRRLSGPAVEGTRLLRLPTRVEGGVLKYVYGEP
jgi:3-phenylpropionate/trans-cinnamate dioxygenase ferredoxin subunit